MSNKKRWLILSSVLLGLATFSVARAVPNFTSGINVSSGESTFNSIDRIGPLSNNPERGSWNPIWSSIGAGRALFADEEFETSGNDVYVYNNSGGDGVQIFWENGDGSQPNRSGKWLRIYHNGNAASPGFGGFITSFACRRNATFVQRFRAKLPAGYYVNNAENSMGNNSTLYWITSRAGTGKWEEYIRIAHCGNSGTFSGGGHVYVTGPSAAFTWYLASANVYEIDSPPGIFSGKVGIGKNNPATALDVNGIVTATGFSGSYSGTLNAANLSSGTFGANTGGGTYYFGGATTNGASHYQFDGATYRDPGTYAPLLNIRQDNATTGITGFKPALTLYNGNGGLDTTVGLDFVSAEGATSAGNSVTLAGIMAIKESTGNVGGWSQGGLLLYTKNFGSRVDALRILNNGNVGIGTTNPDTILRVQKNQDAATDFRISNSNNHASARSGVLVGDAGMAFGLFSYPALGLNPLTGVFGTDSGLSNGMLFKTHTGDINFAPAATTALTIKSGGNVGIGTTAPGEKLEVSGNIKANHLVQGTLVARPYATWSAGGTTAGAIIIKLPGATGNYGMVHVQIDTYEYDGSAATTYICGGHNWNSAWYNYNCTTIGSSDKKVRLAFKDGQYAIVIGEAGSSWSYGHVVLSKITNGGYYSSTMNLGGAYTIYQDNSAESYTWISGNLNNRLAASRSEGRNYIDYARYVYNNGAYSGSGWVEPSDLGVRYASSAGYATSASSATSAGNADTVDGQHFSWANNSNSPTYVWAADSNGSAYLANRSLMSVGYASSAGSLSANGADCPAGQYPLGVNASGAVESCTTDQTGGHGNGSNCSAGYYPLGVDASGNAESCAALSGASVGYASSAGNADTVDNFHLDQSVSTGANVSFGAVTASTVNASTVTATQFIYSDINLKKNITLISDPIEKIKQLKGVTFNWKKDGVASVGVIAQDVEKVFPELVSENEGYKTVQYSNLVAPLIEAVKAQQEEIESLKKQQLESSLAQQLQINSLRAKLQALEMKFK